MAAAGAKIVEAERDLDRPGSIMPNGVEMGKANE